MARMLTENSIEGIHIELDAADAGLGDDEPLSADERTFARIQGYRQAFEYVLAMGVDAHFTPAVSAIRAMHFMMMWHDLSKSPGSTAGEIFIQDEDTGETVCEGPQPELGPD